MTIRHGITKAIRKNQWVKTCVGCRQVAIKDTSDFTDYKLPSYYIERNVTGTICPSCLDEYFERKKRAIYVK